GGDRRGALHLHRLVRAGADARGSLSALAAEEAAAAVQTVRARGDEMPREASGRSLPGRYRAARRSRGGGRQAAGGAAGALAGVVVTLTRSRGIATGSKPRSPLLSRTARFPFPVSRFPRAPPPPPPSAPLHVASTAASAGSLQQSETPPAPRRGSESEAGSAARD